MLSSRGVAFVTYSSEANAQFAKEAMAHQALDHTEILNVRWATVDPNPLAAAREARGVEEQAAEAVRRALPAAFVAEIEGRDPDARKRKRIDAAYGLDGYDAPDDVYYAKGLTEARRAEQEKQLEAPPPADDHPPAAAAAAPAVQDTGILSSSTLAALQTHSAQSRPAGLTTRVAAPPKPPGPTAGSGGASAGQAAPLVGYGSDDDDEDSD